MESDMHGILEDEEYIEEIDTGDGLLRTGWDGLPYERTNASRTGEATEVVIIATLIMPPMPIIIEVSLYVQVRDRIHIFLTRKMPLLSPSRDHVMREPQSSPVSREKVAHSRRLRRENHATRKKAAITKKSRQASPPPATSHITRS